MTEFVPSPRTEADMQGVSCHPAWLVAAPEETVQRESITPDEQDGSCEAGSEKTVSAREESSRACCSVMSLPKVSATRRGLAPTGNVVLMNCLNDGVSHIHDSESR